MRRSFGTLLKTEDQAGCHYLNTYRTDMKNKHTSYRWTLWLGLALMALGIASFFFDETGFVRTEGEILYFGLGLRLLTTGLLSPLIEEIAFRLWAIGPRYGRKIDLRVTYTVGSLLAAFFIWRTSHSWWLAAAVLLVMTCGIFLFRDNRHRTTFMLLATSVCFSLCHAVNYSAFVWSDVFVFLDYVGFALVAAYLVINHNFLWAVLLHALYNCLLLLLLWLLFSSYSCNFETNRYSVEVTPYTKGDMISPEESGDTTWFRGALVSIAKSLVTWQGHADSVPMEDRRTLYHSGEFQLRMNYQLQLVDRAEGKPDYIQVLQGMEREGLVKADTTYEPLWTLYIDDFDRLNTKVDMDSYFSLRDILLHLQSMRLPVVSESGMNMDIPLNINREELRDIESIDSCLFYLEREYGLKVVQSPSRRMQVIEFSE